MYGGASGAAVYSASVSAVKAQGAIVQVKPEDFISVLSKPECTKLVVAVKPSFFSPKWKYATSYKGFTFFTKSKEELPVSGLSEIITADKIWMPDF
jgi:hypothetical protein